MNLKKMLPMKDKELNIEDKNIINKTKKILNLFFYLKVSRT